MNTLPKLKNFLTNWIVKFRVEIEYRSPDISHLEYSGCGKIPSTSYGDIFPRNFINSNSGFYTKGFTLENFKNEFGSDDKFLNLLIKCTHNSDLMQFDCASDYQLTDVLKNSSYSEDEKKKVREYLKKHKMSSDEFKQLCIGIEPKSDFLFDWKISNFLKFQATPVGSAIAISYFTGKTGNYIPWPFHMRNA